MHVGLQDASFSESLLLKFLAKGVFLLTSSSCKTSCLGTLTLFSIGIRLPARYWNACYIFSVVKYSVMFMLCVLTCCVDAALLPFVIMSVVVCALHKPLFAIGFCVRICIMM